MLSVGANTVLFGRVDSWVHQGWSGPDAVEIQAVDRLASLVRETGHRQASIGYEVDIWPFMAEWNVADSRYKVGADLDLMLKSRHGITNLDRCAEGVSKVDTYRIVQTTARSAANSNGTNRLAVARDASFETASKAGIYQVLERMPHGQHARA